MPDANGNPLPTDPQTPPPPTGLLTTSPKPAVTQATSTPATSVGYDPSKYVVTPEQTVEERAAKIAANDSPLMQQAETRAKQAAQAKGLLSSSLAVQAGQNAVLDKAIPIAAQDAATFNKAMTDTVNAENQAKQFGASGQNTASLTNAQLSTNVSLANVDNQTKMDLAVLDSQNRQLLQTNANAASMFDQAVRNIAAISVDQTLSQEAKDAAVQTQLNMLNQGLQQTAKVASTAPAEVQSLNLSQYFDTNPTSMAPEQRTKQQATLQSAVDQAKAQIPVWNDPKWEPLYGVHDGKPKESERSAANFRAMYAQAVQRYQQAQQALQAFQGAAA